VEIDRYFGFVRSGGDERDIEERKTKQFAIREYTI
jgi:hypothetical protein